MKKFAKLIALCMVMTLFCAALFSIPAQALASNSKTIVSTGSVSTGVGTQTTLVDFSTSNLYGFEALGNTSTPAFTYSETWKTSVLSVRINSAEEKTGIQGSLSNTSLLQDQSTLSVRLLAQYAKTTNYTLTLVLEGTDKSGAPLTLTADVVVPATYWQTVTFDISAFTSSANLAAPCTVTLLTSSESESEEFVLWVHSISTNTLSSQPEFLMPAAIAGGGILVGFAFFFVIYCATYKKNKRRR